MDIPHDNYGYTVIVSSPLDLTKDTDGDGVTDYWEDAFGFNKDVNDSYLDTDGDGLTNQQEFDLRINPVASDTDMDGLGDNNEVGIGTDPGNPDTDGDGALDGQEVNGGYNPTDPASHPVVDSDLDGLEDNVELNIYGTNPNNPDTDSDGIFDGYEVSNGLNPLVVNDMYGSDTDGDEWTDWQEFIFGTGASDGGSVPQAIGAVNYGWNSQAEFDLWGERSPW